MAVTEWLTINNNDDVDKFYHTSDIQEMLASSNDANSTL